MAASIQDRPVLPTFDEMTWKSLAMGGWRQLAAGLMDERSNPSPFNGHTWIHMGGGEPPQYGFESATCEVLKGSKR